MERRLGARVVSRWPKRKIQIGMGLALLITAGFGLAVQFHLLPGGGNLLALTGWKLLVAVSVTTLVGALMTLGIGFFAPCMMVTYLLGMNPRATEFANRLAKQIGSLKDTDLEQLLSLLPVDPRGSL